MLTKETRWFPQLSQECNLLPGEVTDQTSTNAVAMQWCLWLVQCLLKGHLCEEHHCEEHRLSYYKPFVLTESDKVGKNFPCLVVLTNLEFKKITLSLSLKCRLQNSISHALFFYSCVCSQKHCAIMSRQNTGLFMGRFDFSFWLYLFAALLAEVYHTISFCPDFPFVKQ